MYSFYDLSQCLNILTMSNVGLPARIDDGRYHIQLFKNSG